MPKRIAIWSPADRAELRAIDRETAWQILQAIDAHTIEVLRVWHRSEAYR